MNKVNEKVICVKYLNNIGSTYYKKHKLKFTTV